MFEIISGSASGVVSGLGMGGGTVLIVLLSVFQGMDQHKAQATNMVFFIPTSIMAIIMNIKNKKIDWQIAKIIIPCGVIGAIIGAVISLNLDTHTLKKVFGAFLGLIAIYEIFSLINMYKKYRKRHNKLKEQV